MIFNGNNKEFLQLESVERENNEILTQTMEKSLIILWFESGGTELIVDGQEYIFKKNQMVFFTEFHRVKLKRVVKIRLA